jgi:hypothetical protein
VLLDHEPRVFTDEDVARLTAAADDLVLRFGEQEAPTMPAATA